MAITFIEPTAGQHCGVGFSIACSTSFVGPLPADSSWQAFLANTAGTRKLARCTGPASDHSFVGTMGILVAPGGIDVEPPIEGNIHGASGKLFVTLFDGVGGIVDSGNIVVTVDAYSGLAYFQWILSTSGVPGDSDKITQILNAVQRSFPGHM